RHPRRLVSGVTSRTTFMGVCCSSSDSKMEGIMANAEKRAKGIHGNPYFKLGKAKAKRDPRNLKLAAILRAPVTLPKEYDFDTQHRTVPTPMFANDTYGDCVIAGRAHQTLRFELIEQGKVLKIKDSDVTSEYFKES